MIELPYIESNLFLLAISLILITLCIVWSIRNKLWHGLSFAVNHYLVVNRLRDHIKKAKFKDESDIDRSIIILPKIKLYFHDTKTRKTGKIYIQNSIKFDKRLEEMRIDSALKHYICERSYLSSNRNYYIYEFYSVDVQKQLEFNSKEKYIEWTKKYTHAYSVRIDERSTLPVHHMALVGQTGSGKSFFIQMLIEQLISKDVSHELYIIDPKRADVFHLAQQKFGRDRTADKRNAIYLIKKFHIRMKSRQDELDDFFKKHHNKTYQDANLPSLILLIDEFGALRESWKTLDKKQRDEVESIIAEIAFMGRQLGCILWIATQQMNAQTISTAIREQLVVKIALGDSDEQTYRTLFASGVDIPAINFSVGQGVFSYPGVASVEKPIILIAPYCKFLDT